MTSSNLLSCVSAFLKVASVPAPLDAYKKPATPQAAVSKPSPITSGLAAAGTGLKSMISKPFEAMGAASQGAMPTAHDVNPLANPIAPPPLKPATAPAPTRPGARLQQAADILNS